MNRNLDRSSLPSGELAAILPMERISLRKIIDNDQCRSSTTRFDICVAACQRLSCQILLLFDNELMDVQYILLFHTDCQGPQGRKLE